MSPEDIKKLLGGYAADTLTTDERQAVIAAALEDQELFGALAREQSLRDLLRDPAARAELLSALDAPVSRVGGFWQWLRRPAVAGLATAGVAAITVFAVWQGTRMTSVKQRAEPVIVAELKRRDAVSARPQAAPPAPANLPANNQRTRVAVPAMAPPPAFQAEAGSTQAQIAEPPAAVMKDKKAVIAMAPPPPPPAAPAPMSALMARDAIAPPPRSLTGAIGGLAPLDARALFYLDQPAPGANGFVQSGGGGGAAPPRASPAAPRKDALPPVAKSVAGLIAPMTAAAPRLGVRVSILRGENEVDLTTVLDPGETVRLKLIPNADGFLYVAEGARLVASGAAQRLQPFETPELRFEGSGQKQLYVMLSRRPRSVNPLSIGSLAGDNLVETSAGQERATYVVSGLGPAGAQQVVVPVTLTYR